MKTKQISTEKVAEALLRKMCAEVLRPKRMTEQAKLISRLIAVKKR